MAALSHKLESLQIESAEADAIVARLGGAVVTDCTGGSWVAETVVGELRVEHRRRPLATAASLADSIAAATGAEISSREALVTADGEFAALAVMGASGVQTTAGFVFGDDHYTQIITTCQSPACFETFSRLARAAVDGCTLDLGARRRRAYGYRSPDQWYGVRRHLTTSWYAPGFPNAHAVIMVADATGDLDVERALSRGASAASIVADPDSRMRLSLRTAGGLSGQYARYFDVAREHVVEVVALADGPFVYRLHMEADRATLEQCRHAFEAVVESIVKLPTRDWQVSSTQVMEHWA